MTMTTSRLLYLVSIALSAVGRATAQDLSPRAYVITPVHANDINLTYSHFSRGLQFDGAVHVAGATASVNSSIFSFYHSMNFFGRSANFVFAVPYSVGDFHGTVFNAPKYAYRSGLLDSVLRFLSESQGWAGDATTRVPQLAAKNATRCEPQDRGPHGQYDPTRLLNWGNNRWAFKPEFGNGVQDPVTPQRSFRVGVTGSVPLTKHQSLKISYSNGAYISYGGDYQNVSLGWQYFWIGWPKFHSQ
jgi:hypothetical protein